MLPSSGYPQIGPEKKLFLVDALGYSYSRKLEMKFLTGDKEFSGMENVEYVNREPEEVPSMSLFAQQLNANSSDRGTIVFLHGGGISGWSWHPVAELLTEYESLIVDLPGHGKSIGIGPFTIKLAANEVSKIINQRTSEARMSSGYR